jgi:Fic-DOC domain mobile mystery protein B
MGSDVSDIFDDPDDAGTPLTAEEKQQLIPTHLAYRRDLNAAEQENIAHGQEWGLRRVRRNLLDERFLKDLHRRMYGDVWRWAGRYRTSERNIGIDHWKIAEEMRVLLDNAKLWIEKKVYPPDEIAVRLHHRLTQIHPFPNGNGRHARLMADFLAIQLGGERFSWGKGSLRDPGILRKQYIDALHAADRYDIGALLMFARA